MAADPPDRPGDQRDHSDLDAKERGRDRGLREVDLEVDPGQQEHEEEAREHEPEAGEQPADAPTPEHAEVDCQLMGFGAGQDLVDGEQPVESRAREPALLVDELPPEHRDLRHRTAEGKEAEPEEASEDASRRLPVSRLERGRLDVGQADLPVPNWRSPASPSPGMM